MSETPKRQKITNVLERALRDRAFRQNLTANPMAVAIEEGLAAEELEIISGGMSSSGRGNKLSWCTDGVCAEGRPFSLRDGLHRDLLTARQ
jgi:hypothetical protein